MDSSALSVKDPASKGKAEEQPTFLWSPPSSPGHPVTVRFPDVDGWNKLGLVVSECL